MSSFSQSLMNSKLAPVEKRATRKERASSMPKEGSYMNTSMMVIWNSRWAVTRPNYSSFYNTSLGLFLR